MSADRTPRDAFDTLCAVIWFVAIAMIAGGIIGAEAILRAKP